jgi:hypothetical protein
VVARRVLDSITPGWQQVGAVWLPLPHLINLFPVQIDWLYRTGASAVAVSVVAFAIAVSSVVWLIRRVTGSRSAAAAGACVLALNPNVLFLQGTPMTEPLLMAFSGLGTVLLDRWVRHCQPSAELEAGNCIRLRDSTARAGWVMAAACLTRYEAWPMTAAALAAAWWVLCRQGFSASESGRRVLSLARYPIAAVLIFLLNSRIAVGSWLVSSGFFIPENTARGRPLEALSQVFWGMQALGGEILLAVAAAGLAGAFIAALISRTRAAVMLPLALTAAAILPWYAFVQGHPFRVRYLVPLLFAEAVCAGLAVGLTRRIAPICAALVIASALWQNPPLMAEAPMVLEAQWDLPNSRERTHVTEYLRGAYDGTKILISMGALAHYMHELSGAGFRIADFVHEGNHDIWDAALEAPHPFVGWVMIEEHARGGDLLATLARQNPHFLDGFVRVAQGGGVALYRRMKN